MVARVTRLVTEKFVLSTFPRALTTLSSMCSRAVRALESSPGLIMMMDNGLKTLIQALAGAGERRAAMYCANKLIMLPGMDEIYQQLTNVYLAEDQRGGEPYLK